MTNFVNGDSFVARGDPLFWIVNTITAERLETTYPNGRDLIAGTVVDGVPQWAWEDGDDAVLSEHKQWVASLATNQGWGNPPGGKAIPGSRGQFESRRPRPGMRR